MKNTLIITLSALLIWSCGSTKNEEKSTPQYSIKGTITNANNNWIVLKKYENSNWQTIDSVQVVNDQFSIEGKVELPEFHYLMIGSDMNNVKGIFLENSEITINGNLDSLDDITIEGSSMHDKFSAYAKEMTPYRDRIAALYPKYHFADSTNDEAMKNELDSIYDQIDEEKNEKTKSIIAANSDNPFGPYLATTIFFTDESIDELRNVLSSFDSAVQHSTYVIKLSTMLETWEKLAVGQPAINFTQNDTIGNPISLDSFKGQYLLIDFWASWCGPCRAENPNLVALYNDMHDKGFEILGVSFDNKKDKDKWLKAIKDDKLTWPQVSDLGGWGNAAGKLYGVRSIPHTVLLDKDGVIIAKNLRGEKLREKLEEVLL